MERVAVEESRGLPEQCVQHRKEVPERRDSETCQPHHHGGGDGGVVTKGLPQLLQRRK